MNHQLRSTLRLNATTCVGFGALFALAPDSVGAFLDGFSPAILQWIGIGLIANGLHLGFASTRKSIGRGEMIYFILGDLLWVLGSFVLAGLVPGVIHSLPAISATLGIAMVVGCLAVLQTRWGWEVLTRSSP